MKLLFDQNISPRLARDLVDLYPGSKHVREIGLESAADGIVWDYAKANGYAIVSKDGDFHQRSFLLGFPPKVIWVRLGNCSTGAIKDLLRDRYKDILTFDEDEMAAFLILS